MERYGQGLSQQRFNCAAMVQFKRYQHKDILLPVREALCEDAHDIVQIPLNTSNSAVAASSIKINMGNLNVELPDTIPAATLRSVIEVLKC